jgi:hypothetical protein
MSVEAPPYTILSLMAYVFSEPTRGLLFVTAVPV